LHDEEAMRAPRFTIGAPVAWLVSRLPAAPPAFVLARALDFGVGRVVAREQVAPLRDKCFALVVRDLGLSLRVESTGRGFRVARAGRAPDLTVTATLADFVALAMRDEDPDTLFFARRLAIEGDTELGLVVKNLLDGIDWDAILPRVPGFPRLGRPSN
jgi:predicted lipid carrier protein YhbT